jgi:ATP synthase protein I
MSFDYKKNRAWAENFQIVMQLGLTMVGCIMFCLYIGYKLDNWLGTKGIFVSIFILLGVVGGGAVAYRQILEVFEEKKNRDNKNGEDQ